MPSKVSLIQRFSGEYEKQFSEHLVRLPFQKVDIFYRPLKTREQKVLLKAIESNEDVLINRAFDEVIQAIVTKWNGIRDPKEMYLKDRFYLLLSSRAKSKSSEIIFTPDCPLCGNKSEKIVLDIDKAEVKELPDELRTRKVKLLDGRYSLVLEPPRRKDEIEKDKYKRDHSDEFKNRQLSIEGFLTEALMIQSVEAEGEKELVDFPHRVQIMDSLTGLDKEKIDEYVNEISKYGFQNVLPFACNAEGCHYKGEIPVDTSDFLFK